MNNQTATIVAQATAIGKAGIGVVRVSGPNAYAIAKIILKRDLVARYATYCPFYDQDQALDYGIAIYFAAPHSFTGEEVVEFQGHGGQVVLMRLIQLIQQTGLARIAEPGEFSLQAFTNGKLDIVQAEAVADLIDATSLQAAKAAINSLSGGFSREINQLLDQLIDIRSFVEASIDFPDEDLELIGKAKILQRLRTISQQVDQVYQATQQGVVLRDGITVVIIGEPNAGKSSLLNLLAQEETAIVSDIAGTTRDAIRRDIYIDGIPLLVIDTAGLRETQDKIEQIGISRSYQAMQQANLLLFVSGDGTFNHQLLEQLPAEVQALPKIYLSNKFDLNQQTSEPKCFKDQQGNYHLDFSATQAIGFDNLKTSLKELINLKFVSDSNILARERHLVSFAETQLHLAAALAALESNQDLELLAEDLRLAQYSLGNITGRFTQDDLLGNIFSSFCIGK